MFIRPRRSETFGRANVVARAASHGGGAALYGKERVAEGGEMCVGGSISLLWSFYPSQHEVREWRTARWFRRACHPAETDVPELANPSHFNPPSKYHIVRTPSWEVPRELLIYQCSSVKLLLKVDFKLQRQVNNKISRKTWQDTINKFKSLSGKVVLPKRQRINLFKKKKKQILNFFG